jgi:hypothetical protein
MSLEQTILSIDNKKSIEQINGMLYRETTGESVSFLYTSDAKKSPYEHEAIDVIKRLTYKKENEISYLEIGVDEGETFDKVEAAIKHGVDPYGGSKNITHRMSSQEFFAYNKYFWRNTYDIIFIDGLHLSDIVMQEVFESLKILNPGGIILLHDIAPSRESYQEVWLGDYDRFIKNKISLTNQEKSFREYCKENPWIGMNGDAWRVMAHLRINNPDLTVTSVPTSCCGIITKDIEFLGQERPEDPEDGIYSWEYYKKNMKHILNPISIDQVYHFAKLLCHKRGDV